jgi:hypothetical protein
MVSAQLIRGDLPFGHCGCDRRGHAFLTMKALNRNRHFPLGFPMRAVPATILCPLAALALSGVMLTAGYDAACRLDGAASSRSVVPLETALDPGNTVLVGERRF